MSNFSLMPYTKGTSLFKPFNGFDLDRLLDDMFVSSLLPSRDQVSRAVTNEDESVDISFVAPGVNRKDFNLSLVNSVLTVELNVEDSDSERSQYAKSFKQSWRLNADIIPDDISATYRNGILTVHVEAPPPSESISTTIEVR